MKTREYTNKDGEKRLAPVIKNLNSIAKYSDEGKGFCVRCGHVQGYCEPDARKYVCEKCKEAGVYGFEELLMMGLIK